MAAISDAEILREASERFRKSQGLAEMGCPQRAGEMAGFLAELCKAQGRPELAKALELMVKLEADQIRFQAKQLLTSRDEKGRCAIT